MRRSMTAYGRAALQTERRQWTVEISSVNRKGLDLHLQLPPSLLFFDPILRKWIGQETERGNITVRVTCELKEASHLIEQLKTQKKKWEKVALEVGSPQAEITLSFLLAQTPPQEAVVDKASLERELGQVWKKGSEAWMVMKHQEGRLLVQEIQKRIKIIQKEMKEIEKELPALTKEHLVKLSERMKELELTLAPGELLKEAALQADKCDITEEIVRLQSHIQQMALYLKSPEKSVGRTLDFLAQEMGREIGTLMAKASSSKIAQKAVQIKSEIEKIREQVQNIE